MPYTMVGEIVDDLASFMDETDATTYDIPPSRRRRLGHYVQRTYDEIWNYRPWNFKFALKEFSFSNGYYSLPGNFGNVGDNGALWKESDNAREPWAEIAIQDMVALRAAGRDLFKRWFAIGLLSQSSSAPVSSNREIWIPKDDVNYGPFKLFFEMSPETFNLDDLDNQPVPLPQIFHNVLFAGAVAKLQEAKGDPKSIWRAEYVANLAKVTARYHVNSSRMEQMPNTVGRMW